MKGLHVHIPGRPGSAEPGELVALVSKLHHPRVSSFGVTTTADGHWAVLVSVKKGTRVPIKEIEKKVQKFPVIYLDEKGRLPLARPAYPSRGE